MRSVCVYVQVPFVYACVCVYMHVLVCVCISTYVCMYVYVSVCMLEAKGCPRRACTGNDRPPARVCRARAAVARAAQAAVLEVKGCP